VAGRLWCGFACPQTVYTEMFMWLERRIEGDRAQRMKRDSGDWTLDRTARALAKHGVWVALALWTGFTFVGYFTPIETLWASAMRLGFGPWEWFWVLFYGFATYGNAGFMREQVCKYMCPYARFQSAMFDKDTMIISYDTERGEPRGTRGRKTDLKAANLGSCIDCGLCVQVCPTGIDIRQGLQYECIGCAACIDVCDGVMDKMRYPRGLIRYGTQNGMANHWTRGQMLRHVLRPRVLVYTSILLVITAALATSLWLRAPFKADVVRDRASIARMVDDGWIENVYRLQLMNTTERPQRYAMTVSGLPGAVIEGGEDVAVGPAENRWVPVSVRVPPEAAAQAGPGAHALMIRIQSQGPDGVTLDEKTTFLVPR
jgi:cytochrome c oxidase accessory protein FixG